VQFVQHLEIYSVFFSSGLREEMNQYLNKIKSTGKKVPVGRDQVTIEDAENTDNIMTRLFNFQDEIQAQMEHELKAALESSVQVISPAFSKMKQQLVEKLFEVIQKSIKCLDDDTLRRTKTVLAYGGKDLSEQDIGGVLVDSALIDLGAKASQSFFSVITIASEYLYEKIGDRLKTLYDEITTEIQIQEDQSVEEAKRESYNLPSQGSMIKPKPEEKKETGSVIKPKQEEKKEEKKETGSVIKPKQEEKKEEKKKRREKTQKRRWTCSSR